jgi:hypothetical protein
MIAEKNLGFNIKTFSPIAVWIIIFLISTVLFKTIKQIGAGNLGAGSIAFVITYFVMRSLVPEFFDLLQKNEYLNWMHSLLFISVILALVKASVFMFSSGHNSINKSNLRVKSPKIIWNKIFPSEEFGKEYSILKNKLERISKTDKDASKNILSNLNKIRKVFAEYGNNPNYIREIKNKITEIIPQEHEIFEKIKYLRKVNNALENFELDVIKSVKEKFSKLSNEEKDLAGNEIKDELIKLKAEQKIEDFAYKALLYNENFKFSLKNAELNLENGWETESSKWINQAIKYQEKIKDLLKKINEFEKLLEKITLEEIKSIRKVKV